MSKDEILYQIHQIAWDGDEYLNVKRKIDQIRAVAICAACSFVEGEPPETFGTLPKGAIAASVFEAIESLARDSDDLLDAYSAVIRKAASTDK